MIFNTKFIMMYFVFLITISCNVFTVQNSYKDLLALDSDTTRARSYKYLGVVIACAKEDLQGQSVACQKRSKKIIKPKKVDKEINDLSLEIDRISLTANISFARIKDVMQQNSLDVVLVPDLEEVSLLESHVNQIVREKERVVKSQINDATKKMKLQELHDDVLSIVYIVTGQI